MTNLKIEYTRKFKRDFKLAKRRGLNLKKLENIILQIERQEPLSDKLKDHELINSWKGYRELHITFDWILIYKLEGNRVIFVRTGTHHELLGI